MKAPTKFVAHLCALFMRLEKLDFFLNFPRLKWPHESLDKSFSIKFYLFCMNDEGAENVYKYNFEFSMVGSIKYSVFENTRAFVIDSWRFHASYYIFWSYYDTWFCCKSPLKRFFDEDSHVDGFTAYFIPLNDLINFVN